MTQVTRVLRCDFCGKQSDRGRWARLRGIHDDLMKYDLESHACPECKVMIRALMLEGACLLKKPHLVTDTSEAETRSFIEEVQ